jgi:single-strand DNA-binding protein
MPFGAEVTFAGQLITPPKLDWTQSGQATCKFTLLVSRTWRDRKSGDNRETKAMFPVVTWGTLAENTAASLEKGDRVLVTGRLEEKSWDDEHRERHSRIELTANDLGPCTSWANFALTRNPRRTEPEEAAPTSTHEDEEPF